MSFDLLLADDAPREALAAIVDAHPAGKTFVKPLLRYIGLFAPEKSQMNHRRMAALIQELVPDIHAAQIERNGRNWSCPIAYWQMAFEQVLAQRDSGQLRLPLKSHGYLYEVLVGFATRDEGKKEQRLEDQRAGVAGAGLSPSRQAVTTTGNGPQVLNAALSKSEMPQHVREALSKFGKGKKHSNAV